MPNTIEIMVRPESGTIGENLGPNFSISTDIGSANPSTATRDELIQGKIITLSEDASSLTITSTGACTNSINISIDKNTASCFATTALVFKDGNTRAIDESGSNKEFRSQQISNQKIQEIANTAEGDNFQINVFELVINFVVDYASIDEDSNTVKSAVGTSSLGAFDLNFIKSQNGDIVTFDIICQDSDLSYKIIGDEQIGYTIQEWLSSDFIAF